MPTAQSSHRRLERSTAGTSEQAAEADRIPDASPLLFLPPPQGGYLPAQVEVAGFRELPEFAGDQILDRLVDREVAARHAEAGETRGACRSRPGERAAAPR